MRYNGLGLGDGLDKSLSRRNKRTVNKQILNIMIKLNNEMKVGTDARIITAAQDSQVCQPNATFRNCLDKQW
jgi:hypothetical protein